MSASIGAGRLPYAAQSGRRHGELVDDFEKANARQLATSNEVFEADETATSRRARRDTPYPMPLTSDVQVSLIIRATCAEARRPTGTRLSKARDSLQDRRQVTTRFK